MFLDYFFYMRSRGLKVSLHEWMTLLEAIQKGFAGESLSKFYFLCRSLVVKNEQKFDLYDQCFAEFFKGIEAPADLSDDVLKWLENPVAPKKLSQEQMDMLKRFDLEKLKEMFEERLKEQHERHDGGGKWVGTGGTSPFGHSGYHPEGIRVGGESRNRSAVQIATARAFRNLRSDIVLDTRETSLALKKLRRLARVGIEEDVDIDETIKATAKNAGDIEIRYSKQRKNTVKLLLLMDVGGSMTYHTKLCEQLFSAAHGISHFKEFRHYYFHNCPYDHLWSDLDRQQKVLTVDVLRNLDESWYLLVVGDAAMSPYELTAKGGCIDYYEHNAEPGYVWLQRIKATIPNAAWLNPEQPNWWNIPSNQIVRKIFPDMFPMTMQGLEDAIDCLL